MKKVFEDQVVVELLNKKIDKLQKFEEEFNYNYYPEDVKHNLKLVNFDNKFKGYEASEKDFENLDLNKIKPPKDGKEILNRLTKEQHWRTP